MDLQDTESCYRAVKSRDRRFDGVFYTAVRTTGIYCRPSCPAVTPQQRNVEFHRTAASAQAAGFRACKRCRPDATPGSPEWDVAADTAGRAMRLIADGVVEREGVEGLSRRLGYTSRHLSRLLSSELGAGPLALARARRAQTARILIETTGLPFAEVAFAAGFASIRQFNDTVREVYASSPSEIRHRVGAGRSGTTPTSPGRVTLRLAVRRPFAARELLLFLAVHSVPGVEANGPGWHARSLSLPHGTGTARIEAEGADPDYVSCTLHLADVRDLSAAVERCRRLVDADCDPVAVDDVLAADPRLAPLVRRSPGLRVPGHVDGSELAVRAVLGQQVSLAQARNLTGALVERYGEVLDRGADVSDAEHPVRVFPTPEVLAGLDPETLPMPRSRGRALVALATALAEGAIVLDRGADREETRQALLALPGIGPWTADYIALRALGDPDVFLTGDVGVRNALVGLGLPAAMTPAETETWRPWRSYALLHLWTTLPVLTPEPLSKEN